MRNLIGTNSFRATKMDTTSFIFVVCLIAVGQGYHHFEHPTGFTYGPDFVNILNSTAQPILAVPLLHQQLYLDPICAHERLPPVANSTIRLWEAIYPLFNETVPRPIVEIVSEILWSSLELRDPDALMNPVVIFMDSLKKLDRLLDAMLLDPESKQIYTFVVGVADRICHHSQRLETFQSYSDLVDSRLLKQLISILDQFPEFVEILLRSFFNENLHHFIAQNQLPDLIARFPSPFCPPGGDIGLVFKDASRELLNNWVNICFLNYTEVNDELLGEFLYSYFATGKSPSLASLANSTFCIVQNVVESVNPTTLPLAYGGIINAVMEFNGEELSPLLIKTADLIQLWIQPFANGYPPFQNFSRLYSLSSEMIDLLFDPKWGQSDFYLSLFGTGFDAIVEFFNVRSGPNVEPWIIEAAQISNAAKEVSMTFLHAGLDFDKDNVSSGLSHLIQGIKIMQQHFGNFSLPMELEIPDFLRLMLEEFLNDPLGKFTGTAEKIDSIVNNMSDPEIKNILFKYQLVLKKVCIMFQEYNATGKLEYFDSLNYPHLNKFSKFLISRPEIWSELMHALVQVDVQRFLVDYSVLEAPYVLCNNTIYKYLNISYNASMTMSEICSINFEELQNELAIWWNQELPSCYNESCFSLYNISTSLECIYLSVALMDIQYDWPLLISKTEVLLEIYISQLIQNIPFNNVSSLYIYASQLTEMVLNVSDKDFMAILQALSFTDVDLYRNQTGIIDGIFHSLGATLGLDKIPQEILLIVQNYVTTTWLNIVYEVINMEWNSIQYWELIETLIKENMDFIQIFDYLFDNSTDESLYYIQGITLGLCKKLDVLAEIQSIDNLFTSDTINEFIVLIKNLPDLINILFNITSQIEEENYQQIMLNFSMNICSDKIKASIPYNKQSSLQIICNTNWSLLWNDILNEVSVIEKVSKFNLRDTMMGILCIYNTSKIIDWPIVLNWSIHFQNHTFLELQNFFATLSQGFNLLEIYVIPSENDHNVLNYFQWIYELGQHAINMIYNENSSDELIKEFQATFGKLFPTLGLEENIYIPNTFQLITETAMHLLQESIGLLYHFVELYNCIGIEIINVTTTGVTYESTVAITSPTTFMEIENTTGTAYPTSETTGTESTGTSEASTVSESLTSPSTDTFTTTSESLTETPATVTDASSSAEYSTGILIAETTHPMATETEEPLTKTTITDYSSTSESGTPATVTDTSSSAEYSTGTLISKTKDPSFTGSSLTPESTTAAYVTDASTAETSAESSTTDPSTIGITGVLAGFTPTFVAFDEAAEIRVLGMGMGNIPNITSNCSFIDETGTVLNSILSNMENRSGNVIEFHFTYQPNSLIPGKYNISCEITGTNFQEVLYPKLQNLFEVYGLMNATSTEPAVINMARAEEATIRQNLVVTGTNFYEASGISCALVCLPNQNKQFFCISNNDVLYFPALYINATTVLCDITMKLRPPVKLSVFVTANSRPLKEYLDRLQSGGVGSLLFVAPPPKIEECRFTSSMLWIICKFDGNVIGSENCTLLFQNDEILGTKSTCQFRGSFLEIKPSSDATISVNDALQLIDNQIGHYVKDTTIEGLTFATGNATVLAPDKFLDPSADVAILPAREVGACNLVSLKSSVFPVNRFVNLNWNVEVIEMGGVAFASQAEVPQEANNALKTIKEELGAANGSVIDAVNYVEFSNVPANYTYKFILTVTFLGKSTTFDTTVKKLAKDKSLTVRIVGGEEPFYRQIGTRLALIIQQNTCSNVSSPTQVSYGWRADNELSLASYLDSSILIGPPLILRAGSEFTVKGIVDAFLDGTNETETATKMCRVIRQGPSARIKYGQKLERSTKQSLEFASESVNLDGSSEIMYESWELKAEDGSEVNITYEGTSKNITEYLKDVQSIKFSTNPLNAGNYIVRLTATIGSLSDTAMQNLAVYEPKIDVSPPQMVVMQKRQRIDPNPEQVIKAYVEWTDQLSTPYKAYWTASEVTGYATADIPENSRVFQPLDRHQFNLVIPQNSLTPGKRHRFRLSIEYSLNGVSDTISVFTDVETFYVPVIGEVLVSPQTGQSLRDLFTVTVTDNNCGAGSTKTPVNRAYLFSDAGLVAMTERIQGGFIPPFNLKAGSFPVVIVSCCTEENTICVSKASETVVVTKANVSDISNYNAATVSSHVLAALNEIDDPAVTDIINQACAGKLGRCVNVDSNGTEVVDPDSSRDAMRITIEYVGKRNNRAVGRRRRNTAQNPVEDNLYRVIGVTLNNANIRSESQTVDSVGRRKRRSLEEQTINDQEKGIKLELAKDLLNSLSTIWIGKRKTSMYELDRILSGLCLSQTFELSERVLKSTEVVLRTWYPDFSTLKTWTMIPATCNTCFSDPASYSLGESVLTHFSSWVCSITALSNCKGACLATAQLSTDQLTEIVALDQVGFVWPVIRSRVAYVQLINPESGAFLIVNNLANGNPVIQVKLEVSGEIAPTTNYTLECRIWPYTNWTESPMQNMWDSTPCSTLVAEGENATTVVTCNCRTTGYVAVFQGPPITPTTMEPTSAASLPATTKAPPLDQPDYSVVLTLQGVYDKDVAPNKAEFEYNMTVQVADEMGVATSRIANMVATKGSIILSFMVKGGTNVDVDLEEKLEELKRKAAANQLQFIAADGSKLSVTSVSVTEVAVEDRLTDGEIAGIVIGIILAVIVFTLIIIIVVAYYKKKHGLIGKIEPEYEDPEVARTSKGVVGTYVGPLDADSGKGYEGEDEAETSQPYEERYVDVKKVDKKDNNYQELNAPPMVPTTSSEPPPPVFYDLPSGAAAPNDEDLYKEIQSMNSSSSSEGALKGKRF